MNKLKGFLKEQDSPIETMLDLEIILFRCRRSNMCRRWKRKGKKLKRSKK